MNAAHARGAVTTRDRARHMIAAQLEADFCLPHGSVAKAHGQGTGLLAQLQLPADKMGSSRRRNDDIWELRVANYAGVGLLCAKHPRVLEKAREYMAGDNPNWLGYYAQLRQLNELLTPYSQQVSGTSIYYTPTRALLESVVPENLPAQEVKCAVPGIGMMRRVDSASLRHALYDQVTGEHTIVTAPNASAAAIETSPEDTAGTKLPVRFEFLTPQQCERFRGDTRYANALGFSCRRPDVTVLAAYGVETEAADPIALVGASDDSPLMRQIGVDVLPEFRHYGLASRMIREVTRIVLAEGYLPFYGTSPSHILSQRTAAAAGLTPTWWEFVSTSLHDMQVD